MRVGGVWSAAQWRRSAELLLTRQGQAIELPGQVALMTGATGFVGWRTAQRLVLAGIRVRGLVHRLVELPDLERSR